MTPTEVKSLYNHMLMRYARSNALVKITPKVWVTYYGKWEYIDSSYLWQAEFYFCSLNGKPLYAYLPKVYAMYILWTYDKPTKCVETLKPYATIINAFTGYLNAHDMHVIKYIRLEKAGD